MMAFADRDPRDCVGESKRAAVRGKLEVSRDLETVIAQGPVLMQRLPQLLNLVGAQRLDAAFARLAVFIDEIGSHGFGLYRRKKPAPKGRQSGDSRRVAGSKEWRSAFSLLRCLSKRFRSRGSIALYEQFQADAALERIAVDRFVLGRRLTVCRDPNI